MRGLLGHIHLSLKYDCALCAAAIGRVYELLGRIISALCELGDGVQLTFWYVVFSFMCFCLCDGVLNSGRDSYGTLTNLSYA